jgi:hypothetical protein
MAKVTGDAREGFSLGIHRLSKLIEIMKTCEGLSAVDSVSRIMAGAHSFAEGASRHDGMTVVVLHVLSSAAAPES